MASSAQARTGGAQPLWSIGQVLARLVPDFPELTPSKLRFLEEQGLVSPARTESGYRKFTASDIERLRLVLSMQRDHYLPLKVIRKYLRELDEGLSPTLPGGVVIPAPTMFGGERRYRREELLAETGASSILLAEAVTAGLLPASETYTDDSVGVLRSLVELQRSGIEPRHLRGLRAAAERELALIQSALTPLAKRPESTSGPRVAELAREMAAHLQVVRGSLTRAALNRLAP